MKILGTGLSGMIGSRVVELLSDRYEFEDLSLEKGADIRDKNQVFERIKKSEAKVVLHLAAKTDVDECEKDKTDDITILPSESEGRRYYDITKLKNINLDKVNWDLWRNSDSTFAINVMGTKNIVDACERFEKKMIYISTDFVFDGEKDGAYTEEDEPDPINFYGLTKYLGEKCVQNSKISWLICRSAYPYNSKSVQKRDFVQKIMDKLSHKEKILALIDHIFCPTLIDDIAMAVHKLLQFGASGIYHLVGSQHLTPYEAALAIAQAFGYDQRLIKKITMEKFYKDRAPRPKNLALSNEKIKKLEVKMKGFEEGLEEISKS